ncbi:hypothetical protein LINGRAHAP2_LOCUS11953 [Linum grandiflorum]
MAAAKLLALILLTNLLLSLPRQLHQPLRQLPRPSVRGTR